MMIAAVMAIIKVLFITFPVLGVTYTIMTLLQVTGRETTAVALVFFRKAKGMKGIESTIEETIK